MIDIEKYLLTVLGEEGSEVAQDASKAIRFGIHDINVLNPHGPDNVERLVKEANEFLAVMNMLVRLGTIPADWQNKTLQAAKVAKVKTFMCYSIKAGELDVKPGQVFDGQIYCPACGEYGEFHNQEKEDCKSLTLIRPQLPDETTTDYQRFVLAWKLKGMCQYRTTPPVKHCVLEAGHCGACIFI